jgi:ABC-type multidrug transport system fused ATPase/permease subunit
MQEIIQGIRVIKYYAWEKSFLSNLFDLRQIELDRVKKAQNLRNLTGAITISVPIFSTILTFLVYHYLGYDLKPEIVFPVMTYFNQLRLPLVLLPMVISMMVDAKVALKRLQDFLMAEELQFEPVIDLESKAAISMENGIFEWEDVSKNGPALNSSTSNLLINESTTVLDKAQSQLGPLNISVSKGSLVAIVGPVGSGKSSLLNAIVGEMKYISGKVVLGGSLGYSPQQSWIQNKNVKDNILFGRPFDEDRYNEVLRACALEKDLQSLPDGDLTEIGEKGVNISGGQKQRISLARIIYSQNDIVLLDDPLSAVDAHVGKHIFDHCINGLLKDKTRVLVTHQLHLLPQVDYIIVMENMKLSMQGTMSELMKYESSFATLMKDHGQLPNDEIDNIKEDEKQKQHVIASSAKPLPLNGGQAKKLVTVEERSTGAVAWSVYQSYIEWGGGASFIGSIVVLMTLYNGARILNDLWLSFWTEHPPRFNLSNLTWASVYLGFGISQALFGFFLGMVFAVCGVKASSTLHGRAATQVVHSPLSFFDQNPLGRIINRFSKDQDTVDNQLPESLRSLMTMLGTAFTAFALISLVSWSFVLPLLVLIVLYYWIQNYYRASSRELKRLDSLMRSPLYAQYSETLTGLATIRAFRDQERFIQTFNSLADKQNQPAFLQMSALRWLGLRLETVGNCLVLAACLSCYIFRVSASQTGLAVGYSLSVSGVLNWLVRQLSETETNVIASERLGQYAQLKGEEDEKATVEDETEISVAKELPEDWPKQGTVSFEHLTLKYRPDLPPVLKDINFSVKAGERIGIIGRTGAGKSSIMTVLFQMVRQSSGQIFIDGQDISQIPLERLRKSISIIPQDPVVFSGTIRGNLDPFSQYTDAQIWSALRQGYLSDAVSKMEGSLDAVVQEGGENLSVGQRQLLCLVRAILRRNRIIVLDEATANIDLATDALIQASLRRDFPGCTLLTIAHRLNTVIDYDKILGIEAGSVVEFGAPADLLSDPGSLLSTLVKETGASNEALLKSKAQASSSID